MLPARITQYFVVAVAATLAPFGTTLTGVPSFVEGWASAGARLPLSAERAIAGVTAEELRAHVEVLASDEFAGRGVGQPGNGRAEAYVEEAMRRTGASPAAGTGYLQPVRIYQPGPGAGGRLTIHTGDERILDLRIGEDFQPLPESGAGTARGRLVFAGHGVSAPDRGHDDFAGRDVRGAVVLVLDGAPALLVDARGDFSSVGRKARDAAARGAAGVIVSTAHLADVQALWSERGSRNSIPYRLYSDAQQNGVPVVAASARSLSPVRRAIDAGLEVTATATSDVAAGPLVIHNVLGIVEGRAARAEMIVLGAHLDHDGVDAQGRVYNGADDNASGTAAVLAIARAFARAAAEGERPHRAVLFALWNGEEKGSLGAEAYVHAPQPARRIVASINLDMIGRAENVPDPQDPRFRGFPKRSPGETANVVHLLGYTYSADLAGTVTRANEEVGLTIRQEYDHGAQNLLRRSDHWPFLRRGIPAVFLTTGLHPEYHTPDDDVERLDFGKLERVARLAARAAWLAAEGPAPKLTVH